MKGRKICFAPVSAVATCPCCSERNSLVRSVPWSSATFPRGRRQKRERKRERREREKAGERKEKEDEREKRKKSAKINPLGHATSDPSP